MSVNRRLFLAQVASVTLASPVQPAAAASSPQHLPKAVAFDAFTVIDSRPLSLHAQSLFPAQGEALMSAWRARQFEYTWLRTLTGRYSNFWSTTRDALVFAARSLHLTLGDADREALMNSYLELPAWPDAAAALERLRSAGLRCAFLSNFTAAMLDAPLRNSGLAKYFESHLTTDRVRAFKPDPRVYAMALEAFQASREQIVFCAAAGWDALGATSFGYRTFWLNRQQQPAEELGLAPAGEGRGLDELVRFVLGA